MCFKVHEVEDRQVRTEFAIHHHFSCLFEIHSTALKGTILWRLRDLFLTQKKSNYLEVLHLWEAGVIRYVTFNIVLSMTPPSLLHNH